RRACDRHRSTTVAGAVTHTPRAWKTSALPDRLDTDRLPCFATRTPQAATTTAAHDEMLNVPERSPPVPHVSNTSSYRRDTCTACARIARARPTISAGRSPFIARPTSRPAIWAGAARPSMISVIAPAASSLVRSSWRVSLSISAAKGSAMSRLQEIPQNRVPLARQDRLGVELHAVQRPSSMPQSHHDAVLARAGRHFEIVGHRRAVDDERVIARREKRPRDPGEHAAAVVFDR